MAFRPAPTQPNLDRLKAVLLNSGLQTKDNALYQVINQLIDALKVVQDSISGITVSSGTATPHALLDGVVNNDTVAQAPSRGSLIYGDSTSKWNEFPIGSIGRVLASDGTDIVWEPSTTFTTLPGGSSTHVQFNDGGVFGGDAGLTYNKATDTLTVLGAINASGLITGNTGITSGGNVSINGGGRLVFSGAGEIRPNTSDGTDDATITFCGGGGNSTSRGALCQVFGNNGGGNSGCAVFSIGDSAENAGASYRVDSEGVTRFQVQGSTGDVTVYQHLFVPTGGSAGDPEYSFANDTNTGFYQDGADTISTSCGGNAITTHKAAGLGIGTGTFGTSAGKVLSIANGTAPTSSPADHIQIFSTDISGGDATLGLRTERAVVDNGAGVTSNRELAIKINGTTYKLLLST